jgi:hypothetical protein
MKLLLALADAPDVPVVPAVPVAVLPVSWVPLLRQPVTTTFLPS